MLLRLLLLPLPLLMLLLLWMHPAAPVVTLPVKCYPTQGCPVRMPLFVHPQMGKWRDEIELIVERG